MPHRLDIDRNRLVEFCHRRHIQTLSFFGSVLRDDFQPGSDVDVLVEFEPGESVGYIRMHEIEEELSELLGARKVDLVNPKFLNTRIKKDVLESAEVLYAEK